MNLLQQKDQHLLYLTSSKQNSQLQQLKPRISQFSKYFYNTRNNITLIYDQAILYIIHHDYFKLIQFTQGYNITEIAYNPKKNALLFTTHDNQLWIYFGGSKIIQKIKKDYKKIYIFQWVYNDNQFMHFFVAEQNGIHFYKYQQEKKSINIKEVKTFSGKYHCFLYQPITEYLVAFPNGDCDIALLYHFQTSKAKAWYKNGQVEIIIKQDQVIKQRIKKTKAFGLEGSLLNKQLKSKKNISQDYFIDIHLINNTQYMFFYFANQGKLQITPLSMENYQKKRLTIKLPSDSIPIFNIVDNMLVCHLKNQKITFIYDIHNSSFQALVSPYTLLHQDPNLKPKVYNGHFIGRRIVFTDGYICKWRINFSVIYHYLKNQMHIFQFLNRRSLCKIQLIKWMRQNLFSFKLINISKMWKMIFVKITQGIYDQSQIVSIVQIYSNLFYTLSIEPLVNKQMLVNNLIQCIRQALQFQIIIPDELLLLLTQLLISTQKIQLLTYLCHHNIININKKTIMMMFDKSIQMNHQLLYTTAIDLAAQGLQSKDILKLLMKKNMLKQGKRFIKQNYQKMNVLDMLETCKYINNRYYKSEFIIFLKLFISFKYPTMNMTYFDQAEKELFK